VFPLASVCLCVSVCVCVCVRARVCACVSFACSLSTLIRNEAWRAFSLASTKRREDAATSTLYQAVLSSIITDPMPSKLLAVLAVVALTHAMDFPRWVGPVLDPLLPHGGVPLAKNTTYANLYRATKQIGAPPLCICICLKILGS
jgi:hypothetical protein